MVSEDSDPAASVDQRLQALKDALGAVNARSDGLWGEFSSLRVDRDAHRARIEQGETRLQSLSDDLNGMRVWMVNLEERVAACRRGLVNIEDAARNVYTAYDGLSSATADRLERLEERVRKLEGGSDVGDE